MMSQLPQVFNYQEHNIRVILRDGQPWWIAKDVCEVLEINQTTRAVERLDDDEKGMSLIHTPGGEQEMLTVNEPGLYSLILGSRKPEARVFKRWITHEVIPSIRKHGAYLTPEKIEEALLNPDVIINLATKLKEERTKRVQAEKQLEESKPKVLFAEAVTVSSSSILIGELAKLIRQNGIDIGQNRLFLWMRENGYLCKQKGENFNLPTQYAMDLGLFEIKKTVTNNPDGSSRVNRTPKASGKGQIYFINKFLKESEVAVAASDE